VKRLVLVIPVLVLLVALVAIGCTNKDLIGPTPKADEEIVSSCVTCHIDKETLQEVASPEPEPTVSEATTGEG